MNQTTDIAGLKARALKVLESMYPDADVGISYNIEKKLFTMGEVTHFTQDYGDGTYYEETEVAWIETYKYSELEEWCDTALAPEYDEVVLDDIRRIEASARRSR